jgi:hypothetical protein
MWSSVSFTRQWISPLWNELSHQVAPSRPKYGTGLGQTEEEK